MYVLMSYISIVRKFMIIHPFNTIVIVVFLDWNTVRIEKFNPNFFKKYFRNKSSLEKEKNNALLCVHTYEIMVQKIFSFR